MTVNIIYEHVVVSVLLRRVSHVFQTRFHGFFFSRAPWRRRSCVMRALLCYLRRTRKSCTAFFFCFSRTRKRERGTEIIQFCVFASRNWVYITGKTECFELLLTIQDIMHIREKEREREALVSLLSNESNNGSNSVESVL